MMGKERVPLLSPKSTATYIDYIIYLCLLYYHTIDCITGYLLLTYNVSVSLPFKVFLSFIMLVSIAAKQHNAFCYVIGYITLFFFYCLVHCNTEFSWAFIFIIKLICVQIFFVYFYVSTQPSRKKIAVFHTILKVNVVVFLCNFGLGLLGFGFQTYISYDIGIKGFFYSGNELSIVFFCLYFYVLLKVTVKPPYIVLIYILAFSIAVLIGTKTGVLAAFLLSIIDYYYRLTKKQQFFFRLFFPIFITAVVSGAIYILSLTKFYSFIEYRIKLYMKTMNWLDVLLAGRAERGVESYALWKSDGFSLFPFFAGTPSGGSYEIDPFDAFFHGGILLLLLTLSFYMYLIYVSYKKKNKFLLFFNIIYLSISFTAGHVWYNVTAGLFYVYINVYELKIKYQDNYYVDTKKN